MSLSTIPYRRSWAEALQEIELKREVAGTSRIEGADIAERELDEALRDETPEDRLSRSQRQARSDKTAYRWIDCPKEYGLHTTVYNQFNYVKAQSSAFSGKGGRKRKGSGGRAAARQPRTTPLPM